MGDKDDNETADTKAKFLTTCEKTIETWQQKWKEKAEEMKNNLDTQELKKLQEVHRDQESLSWYIMKREDELKKLQEQKQNKQEQYNNMVEATQNLIDGLEKREDEKK